MREMILRAGRILKNGMVPAARAVFTGGLKTYPKSPLSLWERVRVRAELLVPAARAVFTGG